MKKKHILFLIIIMISIIFATSCFFAFKRGNYSKTYYSLDTMNEVSLIDIKEKDAKKTFIEIEKILTTINVNMSMQSSSGELSSINKKASIKTVKLSNDMYNVLKKAIYYSNITDGTFDASIGSISSLWNIGNDKARIPSKSEIKLALPLVNYKNILLDSSNNTVLFKKRNMKLDLGGIAKGFCTDKIVSLLRKKGIKNAIINLGGNIYVLGKNDLNKDFSIGIQDPEKESNTPMGKIILTDKSIVTSGIYERYLEKNGKIYHHMLNPKTAYPFENELSSVTIISDKSIDGDALSTSIYGLGLKKGMDKVKTLNGVDAIFITKDKKVYITECLKDKFSITNEKYKLVN